MNKAESIFNNQRIQQLKEDLQFSNGIITGLEIASTLIREYLRTPTIMGMTDVSPEGKELLRRIAVFDKAHDETSMRIDATLKKTETKDI
jgi:hypothetical protein